MNNILYLPMKKKWFDMVFSGEKKEEYREFKPYWMTRVRNCTDDIGYPHFTHRTKDHGIEYAVIASRMISTPLEICFVNGYQKNAPCFIGKCDQIFIRSKALHPEWGEGEYEGKPHFVFHIGHIER